MQINIDDPVGELRKIFKDNLGQDWDILDNPEEVILGVPKGTIRNLLVEIDKRNLWDQVYEVAKKHSDQWMLDISYFFPKEESFVEPLVVFFNISKTEHSRICFAQEADGWSWGDESKRLLPEFIEKIRQICLDLQERGGAERSVLVLESVCNRLCALT